MCVQGMAAMIDAFCPCEISARGFRDTIHALLASIAVRPTVIRRLPLCDDRRNSCLTCVMSTNTRHRTHTCDFVGGLTLTLALTSLGATCMRPSNLVCPIKVYVLQFGLRVAPDTCNSSWQAKLLVGSWRPSPTANGRTPRESSNAF